MFDQAEFEVRCECGLAGLKALEASADVVVIVDVLSFSTAIEIATARGGVVFPYPLKGDAAGEYARSVNAELASADRGAGFSLSPASLVDLPRGYRMVMPSPNGAALAFAVGQPPPHGGGSERGFDVAKRGNVVLAGCLRNATAVARAAVRLGSTIAVIAAGELWPGGELRPCFEDWMGAGAVIAALPGRRSPEAELAAAGFARFRGDRFRSELQAALRASGSGKELIERGFAADVELAAEFDVSANVPRLVERAFVTTSA